LTPHGGEQENKSQGSQIYPCASHAGIINTEERKETHKARKRARKIQRKEERLTESKKYWSRTTTKQKGEKEQKHQER
jgi:hypothetical protein